jgi:hypothetical protein
MVGQQITANFLVPPNKRDDAMVLGAALLGTDAAGYLTGRTIP